MKTTKILLGALRVSALVAVVLAFATSAQAQVVNVEFIPSSGSTYTGLGAASDPGTFWNAITPTYGSSGFTSTPNTLENSTDTALTTVGFKYTSGGGLFPVAVSGNTFANPLTKQLLDLAGNTSNVTITGLTVGQKYNLFFYAQNSNTGANNGVTTFTFGGTPETATNTVSGDTAFNAGVNYVEFADLTANSLGDIVGTWTSPGTSGPNGFQIQEVAAPEPSTYALMGLGALALLVIRRRRMA